MEYMENNQLMELDEEFDPGEFLPDGEYRDLDVITGEIIVYKQQAGAAILEIGRRLIEAKAQLGHGEWLPYLRDRVEFSQATAHRMMRLAKEYSNSSPVISLGTKKALQLLAFSPTEREEFIARNDVENMSSKELQEAIDARKAAEAERDEAIEEARTAREDLMDQLEEQQRVYEADMEAVQAKLREAHENAERARRAEVELKAKLAGLEKPRPAGPAELDAARKAAAKEAREAEAKKLRKQIEEAEKKAAEAAGEKAKAEREASAAKAAYEQAAQAGAKERELLAGELEQLRKKLAMAASSEMTVFKVHFDAIQEQANHMIDCITRARESGQEDMAGKMASAVKGCCQAIINGADAALR